MSTEIVQPPNQYAELIGRVYKERDYRFDRWVRVVDIEQEKAVVVTVRPDASVPTGYKNVFATRRTRIRLDRLTRPSMWEPQAVVDGPS